MADKLSESAWTGFTKKLKLNLDDTALTKALAKVDKTDDTKPEPRIAALEDTVEQLKKQVIALARRKKELGDKVFAEVKGKLDELLEQAEKAHKATLAAVAKASADAKNSAKAGADNGDEEEDSPALLTSKMIPLLRELRKGEVGMHALICTAGKNTAVLIMRKPVPVARRKILAEAVDAKGGAKYIAAECLYQNKALTFVVQAQGAGLAKRLREALLAQTDLRLKVVVRGDDGEEHDGQDEADAGNTASGQAAPGTTSQATQAPSAQQQAYAQRLRKVQEQLVLALKAKHPESTKLRAVIGFASEKAAAGDIAGASKALDMLEKLLSPAGGGAAQTPAQAATQATAKPVVATVVFQQARLAWEATRKKAQGELRDLQKAITVDFKGEPDADEVDTLVGQIGTFLDKFDTRLSDKLDEALNAKADAERLARQQEAALILTEYRGFIETDARLKLLDSNPFMPVTIRKGFQDTLAVLSNKLAA